MEKWKNAKFCWYVNGKKFTSTLDIDQRRDSHDFAIDKR